VDGLTWVLIKMSGGTDRAVDDRRHRDQMRFEERERKRLGRPDDRP
jgi:hypothetical protein